MKNKARQTLFLFLAFVQVFFISEVIQASDHAVDEPAPSIPGPTTLIRLDPTTRQRYVAPPEAFLRGLDRPAETSQATIIVNYIGAGWTPEAQQAFEFAAGIWESVLVSPVPIVVDAQFGPLGAGILGGAGPTFVFRNFANAPQANTWYAAAGANKLANSDLNPGTADIQAVFNSSFPNWYFGTGNNTPGNQISFVTVVLHELAHGLGYSGSMRVDDGFGSTECNGIAGTGCYGFNGSPMIYDRYTEDGSGTPLIDFPNHSAVLAGQLTSNNIFFDSPSFGANNPGDRVELYAPGSWQQGSSYSHVSEAYNNTEAALMTFSIARGETIHNPGTITFCMLKDMGWTLTSGCGETPVSGLAAQNDGPILAGTLARLTADIVGGSNVTYAWNFGDGQIGSGNETTHRYDAPGIYTATVTARNSVNEQSATTFVQVTSAPFRFLAPIVLGN